MGLRAGGGSRRVSRSRRSEEGRRIGGSLSREEDPRLSRRDPSGAIQQSLRREEDPAASLAGRSERGEGIRGGGSSKVFHGGGWGGRGRDGGEWGNPTVCLPRSHRGSGGRRRTIPRALSVSSGGIRQGLRAGGGGGRRAAGGCGSGAPRRGAGTRAPVPPGWGGGRRGAGGGRGPRRQRLLPRGLQQRLGQSRSVSRARWRRLGWGGGGGGPQRLSPSLPLALASSARRQAVPGSVLPGRSPAPPRRRCRRRRRCRHRHGRRRHRRRPQEQSCCHRGHFVAN